MKENNKTIFAVVGAALIVLALAGTYYYFSPERTLREPISQLSARSDTILRGLVEEGSNITIGEVIDGCEKTAAEIDSVLISIRKNKDYKSNSTLALADNYLVAMQGAMRSRAREEKFSIRHKLASEYADEIQGEWEAYKKNISHYVDLYGMDPAFDRWGDIGKRQSEASSKASELQDQVFGARKDFRESLGVLLAKSKEIESTFGDGTAIDEKLLREVAKYY